MGDYQIKLYWQLSDTDLDDLYDLAVEQGLFEWVCHDVTMSRDIFHLLVRRAEVFGAVYDEWRPLGFFFLSPIQVATARIHFAFYQAGRPRRVEIGRAVLAWCFEAFEFQCLIGETPASNLPAQTFALEVGGRRLGEIPGLCWLERLKRAVPGAVTIFERERCYGEGG